jgi:hypothetical protein
MLAGLAAACATQADRMAQAQRDVDEMIAVYGPACDKLGYKRETDQWRDCVLRLNIDHTIAYHQSMPMTTNCITHHGFVNCTTF